MTTSRHDRSLAKARAGKTRPTTPANKAASTNSAAAAGASKTKLTAEQRAAQLMARRRDPAAAKAAREVHRWRVSTLTRLILAAGFACTGAFAVLVQQQTAHSANASSTTPNTQTLQQNTGSSGNNGGVSTSPATSSGASFQTPATTPAYTYQPPQVVSGGS